MRLGESLDYVLKQMSKKLAIHQVLIEKLKEASEKWSPLTTGLFALQVEYGPRSRFFWKNRKRMVMSSNEWPSPFSATKSQPFSMWIENRINIESILAWRNLKECQFISLPRASTCICLVLVVYIIYLCVNSLTKIYKYTESSFSNRREYCWQCNNSPENGGLGFYTLSFGLPHLCLTVLVLAQKYTACIYKTFISA